MLAAVQSGVRPALLLGQSGLRNMSAARNGKRKKDAYDELRMLEDVVFVRSKLKVMIDVDPHIALYCSIEVRLCVSCIIN